MYSKRRVDVHVTLAKTGEGEVIKNKYQSL